MCDPDEDLDELAAVMVSPGIAADRHGCCRIDRILRRRYPETVRRRNPEIDGLP
jgi:hypothetical protein